MCSTRYYDPEIGRWISPDSIDYLDPETINGLNLYAYCNNNPVMLIDSTGHSPTWWNPFTWDWGQIGKGIGLFVLGVGAVLTGIATLPFGGWIAVVAGITIIAGAGTVVFGIAETGEAITNYNIIRDPIFGGNQAAYDLTLNIFQYTAIVGSTICGIYGATHITTTERSLPGKGNKNSGIWNKNDRTLGYYGSDGKLRYSIAFNNHRTPAIHNIPHWHTELPHSQPINNVLKFIWELIKRGF